MKSYARIDGGLVAELFSTDGDITEMFHPELVWVEVPSGADVGCGWRFTAGEFIAPIPTSPTADETAAVIAARRYQAEKAGIIVNEIPLDTGRDSQALVTGAALAAVIDSAYSCQWKTAGGFIDLDAQQIIAIASAMRAHVQACFDREAELLDAVAAGTYSAEQLDQGWPA